MTQPTGPVCMMCEAEPAVISVMALAEYETLTVGQNCLLPYYVTTLETLTGVKFDLDAASAEKPQPDADSQVAGQESLPFPDGNPNGNQPSAAPKKSRAAWREVAAE